MKRFTDEEIEFIREQHEKISGKDIAKSLNRNYGSVKNKIRQLGLGGNEIGKSKFSRTKRKYSVNDVFFEVPTILNSYWAGFISADGCISKKTLNNQLLTLHISVKDLDHLKKFKQDIGSNNPILYSKRDRFQSCGLNIASQKIVDDLYKNFNITERKTFTNKPPNLYSVDMIDSFIMGYIDGDGSISKTEKNPLCLSLIGTYELLFWVKIRIGEILGRESGSLLKNKNMYSLAFGMKASREIISNFKKLPVPYLYRKWDRGMDLEVPDNKRGYHRKKSVLQIDPITNKIITEFDSAVEANISLGVNPKNTSICNHIAGRLKKAHGYKWIIKDSGVIDTEEAN